MNNIAFIFCLLFFVNCNNNNRINTEVFIFPKNYYGIALIFYNVSDGKNDSLIKNKVVYKFDDSGLLFMKKKMRNVNMLNTEYYYLDSSTNELITLQKFYENKPNNVVFADNSAGNNKFGKYKSYGYIHICKENCDKKHLNINLYVDSLLKIKGYLKN